MFHVYLIRFFILLCQFSCCNLLLTDVINKTVVKTSDNIYIVAICKNMFSLIIEGDRYND